MSLTKEEQGALMSWARGWDAKQIPSWTKKPWAKVIITDLEWRGFRSTEKGQAFGRPEDAIFSHPRVQAIKAVHLLDQLPIISSALEFAVSVPEEHGGAVVRLAWDEEGNPLSPESEEDDE